MDIRHENVHAPSATTAHNKRETRGAWRARHLRGGIVAGFATYDQSRGFGNMWATSASCYVQSAPFFSFPDVRPEPV